MNLTDPEVRVLLWHIKVVEDAFGNEAPHQSTIDNAKHKLQSELEENERVTRLGARVERHSGVA